MDSYAPLAQLAVTSRRHDLAFSALPDAPVLPVREPHREHHRLARRGARAAIAAGCRGPAPDAAPVRQHRVTALDRPDSREWHG